VQLWDVVDDSKHSIVTSQRFIGSTRSGGDLPDATVHKVGEWVTNEIGRRYDLSGRGMHVRLHVPADLRHGHVEVDATPAGGPPVQLSFWQVVAGEKSRVSVDPQDLAGVNGNFWLEVSLPGLETRAIELNRGHALDTTFALAPRAVAIGVEEFSGDANAVGARLADLLTPNPRLTIKDPISLAELRQEIARNKALLARSPMVQMALRTSLGLSLLVSGRYDAR
jgi:hypothetical protein